jgi:predicted permease
MQILVQDFRYSIRQLRRSPGFTVVSLVVLALGIGVSTAMFTVLNGVLLRKPAFPHIDRLVTIAEPRGTVENFWAVSLPDARDWRAQNHSLEQLAYYQQGSGRVERETGTQKVDVFRVSGNFFSTLGVAPVAGRTFTDADEQSKARLVIISYQLWKEWFGSDRKALGQTMKIDGQLYQIVGVMPNDFAFRLGQPLMMWTPFAATADDENRDSQALDVVARLRPGVELDQARTELNGIQAGLARAYARDNLPDHVSMRRYWDTVVGSVRPALLLLAAAVALIWLVACANVASLILTRNSVRQRELAIRRALGAGRLRLVRQLLTENLLLSLLASAVGLALAWVMVRTLEQRLLKSLNVHQHVAFKIDSTVLLIVLALSVISTLVFGLMPAIKASGASVFDGLQARTAESSTRHARMRNALIMGEIALSLVLLTGAGLLLRTLYLLHHVPLGFATENIVTSSLSIPNGRYDKENINLALYQPLIERIEQIPGVQSAAVTSVMPLKRGFQMVGMFDIAGRNAVSPDKKPQGDLRFSSPEYPQTLGIVVERGRFFDSRVDTPTSQPVAVVNHTFAARYLPGEDPTTKALSMGKEKGWSAVPIVGVIADVRETAVNLPPGPEIHLSTTQLEPGMKFYQIGSVFAQIAVRTRQNPAALIATIRKTAHDLAPDVATGNFDTMTQVVEDSLGNQTLAAKLVGLFALATLLIAVTGLYGLLSYSVRQRVHEIGIRMALGAQRRKVVVMVLRHALVLLVCGVAAGIALSLFPSRLIRSFLYGVTDHDAITIAAVSLLLCLCGMMAAYLPARRAASVDPMQALRTE